MSLIGTDSGNYTLTQQGAVTGRSIRARALVPDTLAAPSLLLFIQTNTPSATQLPLAALPIIVTRVTSPKREDIFILLVRQPSLNKSGAVSVSLPKDTVNMRPAFSLPMPPHITETISEQSALQITTLQGTPLPSWLRYDVDTKSFAVPALPNGVLPMQVLVMVDQKQTVMLIAEPDEKVGVSVD
jgi:hypothetical protein